MFEVGAEALRRVVGGEGDVYACPICGRPFGPEAIESGDLTVEDVPPISQGGSPLALTCKPCNNQGGTKVDRAVLDREEAERFLRAQLAEGEYEGRTVLRTGDVELRVDQRTKGAQTRLDVVEGANNPEDQRRFREAMLEAENWGEGATFQIRFRGQRSLQQSLVGDLRTAYLVAFAAFGYRYVGLPQMEAVRTQICDPDSVHLAGFWSKVQLTASGHELLSMHAPWPAIVVQLPGRIVILPRPDSPEDLYAQTAAAIERGGKLDLRASRFEWPDRLRMDLDYGRAPEVLTTPPNV